MCYTLWILTRHTIHRGFTLVEVLISVGIVSILASIVAVTVNHRDVFVAVHDRGRDAAVYELHMGYHQAEVDQAIAKDLPIPEGVEQAVPVCKHRVKNDWSCVNLDPLVDNDYMAKIPVDAIEPCASYTGYKIYRMGGNAEVLATHRGKLKGDTVEIGCLEDTIYPSFLNIDVALFGDTATISWDTDEDADAQVEYGILTYDNKTTIDLSFGTHHSIFISGLAGYTTYNVRLLSRDAAGNLGQSENVTFTTTDTAQPVLIGVTTDAVTDTTATIIWATDEPSTTQMEFGLTDSYGAYTQTDHTLVLQHSQTLLGLLPDTLYHFRVRSRDAAGNAATSGDYTFRTLPDTIPPVIDLITVTPVGSTAATVTWITDEPGTSQVEFGTSTSYGSETIFSGALLVNHRQAITGLSNDTLYHFRVSSFDASGNVSYSPDQSVTIHDGDAPEIQDIATTSITGTEATITWETSELADGQVEYGTTSSYGTTSTLFVTPTLGHTVTLTGLTPKTTYHYRVRSRDPAANLATSNDQTFTAASLDPVFSSVSVSNLTSYSATIAWTTDVPADTQLEYGTSTSYGTQTTLDATLALQHSQPIGPLQPSTTYHYRLRSASAQGYQGLSEDKTFTTPAMPAAGLIAQWALDATSGTTSTDDSGHGNTLTYVNGASISTNLPSVTFPTTRSVSLDGVNDYLLTPDLRNVMRDGSVTLSLWFYPRAAGVIVDELGCSAAGGCGWHASHVEVASNNLVRARVFGVTPVVLGSVSFNSWHHLVLRYNASNNTLEGFLDGVKSASAVAARNAPFLWPNTYGIAYAFGMGDTTNMGTSVAFNGILDQIQIYNTAITDADAYALYATSGLADTTPPVITAVASSLVTDHTARITWTTDEVSDSVVEFGTTTAYGQETSTVNLVTAHAINLNGLLPSTTYHYRVLSTDDAGNEAASGDYTFTTLADTTAPSITAGPSVAVNGPALSATVTWTTNEAADTVVLYSLDTSFSDSSTNPSYVTSHTRTLTGLTAGATYNYKVRSTDAYGNTVTSAPGTFIMDVTAPTVTAGPTVTAVTATTATITWTTNEASHTRVEYSTNLSYSLNQSLAPLVLPHTITLTGLATQTLYNYRIKSTDAANNTVTVNGGTFTTGDSTAPVISSVSATPAVQAAAVTWTTNESANSQVEYGLTTAYGSTTTLDPTQVTSHSVTVTGLVADTLYHFRVRSTDAGGNLATSPDSIFTTSDASAPVISGIATSNVGDTGATVSWTTDEGSTTQVEYGLTTSYGSTTTFLSSLVTSHTQALTGLAGNTLYHFRVKSRDANANLAVSADQTFTTTDTSPPVISSISISGLTNTHATVNWLTNEGADSRVEYGTTTAYGSSTTLNTALVTSHSQGLNALLPNTLYHYRITSRDALGNTAQSPDRTFTTLTDVTPPVISGVTATGISDAGATIAWTTNEPADSLIDYGLTTAYGSSTPFDATWVTAHQQSLTGLAVNTTYHYRVRSKDQYGNETISPDYSFTTIYSGAPVISDIAATVLPGETSVSITWTTNVPSNTQVEYGPTVAYGSSTTINGTYVVDHAQTITGLTPGATYHFRVKSRDPAAHLTISGDGTFIADLTPPTISSVAVSAVTGTAASISWTTNEAASTKIRYGTSQTYDMETVLDATRVTAHMQSLTDLQPATLYHYSVLSADEAGNEATSADGTFTTGP